jgi:hypothetical protein
MAELNVVRELRAIPSVATSRSGEALTALALLSSKNSSARERAAILSFR